MSIMVRYSPASMTAQEYDKAHRQIQETLDWPPEGLHTHACFGSEGNLLVSEIWDSREQWEAFGERLMPVLSEAGIEFSGEPEVFEVHNVERR